MGSSPYGSGLGMTSGFNPRKPVTRRVVPEPFAPMTMPTQASQNAGNYQGFYDQQALEQQQQNAMAAAQQAARLAAAQTGGINSTNQYATQTRNASVSNANGPAYGNGSSERTTPGQGDTMDGFARRYSNLEAENVLGNPEVISNDLLGSTGQGALAGDAARYAQMAPLLYKMLVGGNMEGSTMQNDHIINYVAKLIGDMSKVGGAAPNQSQLLNQLYAGLNDPSSEYGAELYGPKGADGTYNSALSTPAEIDKVNKLLGYTGTFTNYGTAQAQQKLADRLGLEYQAAKAKGGMDGVTYMQYVQDKFLR